MNLRPPPSNRTKYTPAGWFDRDDLASWELLHRTFAAVVTVFDAELGRVFDLFRERGLDRSAAWMVRNRTILQRAVDNPSST